MAEVGEAGGAVALLVHPAGNDAAEMRQLRLYVQRDAVQRHPLLHADADGRDLVLVALAPLGAAYPDADPVLAPLAAHIEAGECADDPFLERGDKAAHVGSAP